MFLHGGVMHIVGNMVFFWAFAPEFRIISRQTEPATSAQDAGSKMIHFAPNTTSKVTSKSISKAGGRASFRGLLKVYKGAEHPHVAQNPQTLDVAALNVKNSRSA